MGSLLVVVAVGLALGSAYPIARAYGDRVARLLALGVWSFASLVVALQALGLCAALSGRHCVGGTQLVIVLGVGCLGCWFATRRLRIPSAEGRSQHLPSDGPEGAGNPGARVVPTVLAILAVLLLISALASGLLAPPRGWDVLSYHLPRAVAWLQSGSLQPYGGNTAHYPGNGELLLLTLLFSGSDRLVPVVQLPFALLCALALYGTSRLLGAGRRSSLIVALTLLTMPIIAFQTAIAKNDIVVLAAIMCSVYFAARALNRTPSQTDGPLNLVTAGVAAGLAVGSRYPALPLVVAGVVLTLVLMPRRRDGQGVPKGRSGKTPVLALLAVGAILLPSLYWYASNWVAAGNPLAPFAVRIGGTQLWPGLDPRDVYGEQQFHYVRSVADWWWFALRDRALSGSYSASAGFGAAFAALVIPSALWMLAGVGGPKLRDCWRRRRLLVLSLAGVALISWWGAGVRLPRYMLSAVVLAMPALGVLLESCRRSWRRAAEVLLVVAVAFSSLGSLLVLYSEKDLTSSFLGLRTKKDLYRMPSWVHSLPPGTKIALTRVTDHQYYSTFRYPLVGSLPGNSVVMEGDAGTSFSIMRDGVRGMHDGLVSDGVDYLFIRAFGLEPCRTTHELHPDLYELVLDTVESEYPWFRKGDPVLTKVYRVLP